MNYQLAIIFLKEQGYAFGKPKGNSMLPRIKSGERLLFVKRPGYLVDDVVLCKVKGTFMVHKVLAIKDDKYQIGNNKGHVNGWTRQVYGSAYKPA